jgi:hypothetical protein
MDSNTTGLLPGQSPPLTVITSTDRSGIVLIATALGLIFAIISLLIRLFIRLEFRHQFARDDIAAALAMVCPYQMDDNEWQLTIARYSRYYKAVPSSSKSRKASARPLLISFQTISYRCKRYVGMIVDQHSLVRSHRGTGFVCERHPLHRHPLANEMFRCIPISPLVTEQDPYSNVEGDLACGNCVDLRIYIHCRSTM